MNIFYPEAVRLLLKRDVVLKFSQLVKFEVMIKLARPKETYQLMPGYIHTTQNKAFGLIIFVAL